MIHYWQVSEQDIIRQYKFENCNLMYNTSRVLCKHSNSNQASLANVKLTIGSLLG